MSARRAALISRFRASGADRVNSLVATLLGWATTAPDDAERDRVRRELHTLKGESRMLGFAAIAELVHAIEDRLAADGVAGAGAAVEALRVVGEVLVGAGTATDDAAVARLAAARAALIAASAPAPVASEPSAPAVKAPADRWVSVGMGRVEELCTKIGELTGSLRSLAPQVRERGLRELVDRCVVEAGEVEDTSWALRMVPLAPTFESLAVHALELADELGKRVRVVHAGGDLALERNVLDAVTEPLLHLIRNAIDHGVETAEERARVDKPEVATLELHADQHGAHVVLTVADDGRGIASEEVRAAAVARGLLDASATPTEAEIHALLFRAGFSTRSEVTDLSGRGVGLEVVGNVLDRLGGDIAIESVRGRGCRFLLRVPVKIGKEHVLLVETAGLVVGIAARDIAQVVDVTREAVEVAVGPLDEILAQPGAGGEPARWVVVLETGARRGGVGVGRILGEAELVIYPADRLVAAGGLVRGTTVYRGRPVVIGNARSLIARAEAVARTHPAVQAPARVLEVLLVDDSAVVLTLVADIVERAGMAVRTAMDGVEGLAEIATKQPDLVVSDLEMPNMDGFEFLKNVRRYLPSLPFILLTTRSGEADRARAAELGATAYLTKTEFGEAALLDTIRKHGSVAAEVAP